MTPYVGEGLNFKFTRTTKELLQLTYPIGALIKFISPKFVPTNQL